LFSSFVRAAHQNRLRNEAATTGSLQRDAPAPERMGVAGDD
jgi:hypothetical protein